MSWNLEFPYLFSFQQIQNVLLCSCLPPTFALFHYSTLYFDVILRDASLLHDHVKNVFHPLPPIARWYRDNNDWGGEYATTCLTHTLSIKYSVYRSTEQYTSNERDKETFKGTQETQLTFETAVFYFSMQGLWMNVQHFLHLKRDLSASRPANYCSSSNLLDSLKNEACHIVLFYPRLDNYRRYCWRPYNFEGRWR